MTMMKIGIFFYNVIKALKNTRRSPDLKYLYLTLPPSPDSEMFLVLVGHSLPLGIDSPYLNLGGESQPQPCCHLVQAVL